MKMPHFKKINSLYKQSLWIFYNLLFDYCSNLDDRKTIEKDERLRDLHEFLVSNFPTSVLDDLLEFHSSNGPTHGQSLKSYYFYKAVVHKNIRRFVAKNYNLDLTFWKSLFEPLFKNLVSLNLALSCNDQILELIPKYCPNLEYFNATCRYERLESGANACIFACSVTDYGLRFLCRCEKLKTITVNEPRSNSRGLKNSITYAGLRRLLIHVKTLEDISYSDLGSVVSKGLEHLQSLNLRAIRHFNATESSIREILRLCVNLKELFLTFFNTDLQNELWLEIIKANLELRTLEVMNLNCKYYFSDIFRSIGKTLVILSITNNFHSLTFSNLVTIGRFCPNLTFFGCCQVINRKETIDRPKNFGQFSMLESLNISGDDMDVENILGFCTENADNLENLKFLERGVNTMNIDKIFIDTVHAPNIRHIEISNKLSFTTSGIRRMIAKFPLLNYLNVSCTDDCRDLLREVRDMNYDLVFINKLFIPFQQV